MAGSLDVQVADLQDGDHLCGIYHDTEEKLRTVGSFIKEGLDRNACCVYVADESTTEAVSAALTAAGVQVDRALEQGSLRFLTKWEYRQGLELDPAAMAQVVKGLMAQARGRLWLAVEMTWTLEPEVSHEQLSRWEATINTLLCGQPAVAICLYNRQRFASPVILQSALRTHPLVAVGCQVYPNLYYEPPEVVLDSDAQLKRLDWRLAQLQEVQASRRALEEHRQRLEALFNNALDAILLLDDSMRYVDANPAASTLLGYSREELSRLTACDLLPRTDHPLVQASFEKFIQSGQLSGERTLVRKDGTAVQVEHRSTANITPGLHMAIMRDLTDRRRLEVERELQRLKVLVDTCPVGVLVVDAATRQVALVNPEAQRILGSSYQPGRSLEQCGQDVVYRMPDGQPYQPEDLPLQRTLRYGETVRAEEIRVEFLDGDEIIVLVNATPVYSPDGQLTTAMCVIQDMTPLEQLERLRSEFLGMVSHELRTPLAVIKGSATIALGANRPLDSAEIQEFFEVINEQADRLRGLVDNLLDLTRIEAGSFKVTTEPSDLCEILNEARNTFVRSGGPNPVQVRAPEDLPRVKADRHRVVQVLMNLLGNAAKFSLPTAPIVIEAELDAVYVTVHVQDGGMGIPQDQLAHIFKKFSQVHQERGKKLSGSGLGLAICRGIVKAHGGRIWAHSQGAGQGTVISFSLPVADAPAGGDPWFSPAAAPEAVASWPALQEAGGKLRVLAVDDNPQFQYHIRQFLLDRGYHPIVTGNPAQVGKLVQLESPDLVLLDLVLPGTSGFDLIREIHAVSDVPVVFLTSSDGEEDAARALKMGADDYITKPFSSVELAARLEAVLRRRSGASANNASNGNGMPPFILDDLTINFNERTVIVGGQWVHLTSTEYELLRVLATNAGRVLTYRQILSMVWGTEYAGDAPLVYSFIRSLRRKLGDDGRRPRYILNEPRVGYRMPVGGPPSAVSRQVPA